MFDCDFRTDLEVHATTGAYNGGRGSMRVRALKIAAGELSFRPGQVVDVTEVQARALVAAGAAVVIEEPAAAVADDVYPKKVKRRK